MALASIYPDNPETLRIIPLGGCGEFGMNLTAYLHRNRLFVVDCGVMFPDPMKLGIEAVIPRVHEWFAAAGGVFAYILTHGHEDHIGAMPYVLERWPAPMYATPWTAELLKGKFARRGMQDQYPITVVEPGDTVKTDGFEIEYVHVNHSIPMSCALFIRTPTLKVFHSGDFRIDPTPVIEAPVDLDYLSKLGKEGVDLMLADSTNALKSGYGPSENSVIAPLGKIFDETAGAVIVTTFSSNFWRIKTIIDLCVVKGRKLLVLGQGIDAAINAAINTGIYEMPLGVRIDEETASMTPRDKICVVATGSQGEWRSAMTRLSLGEHKGFRIQQGDTVVFSSRIIPGNERVVQNMMSWIEKAGGKVITTRENPAIHVSGHAYRGEITEFLQRLKPNVYLPIHGTFSHMHANQSILKDAGLKSTQTLLIENGDVIDVTRESVQRVAHLDIELEFIDGGSYLPISYETLRDRLRVGEFGGAFISGVFSAKTKQWTIAPKIQLQGIELSLDKDLEVWLQETAERVARSVTIAAQTGTSDPAELNEEARVALRRILTGMLNRKPVVTTQIFVE